MATAQGSNKPGESSTPPIPPRNPRRVDSVYKVKRHSITGCSNDHTIQLSSLAAHTIIEEIDHEIDDTQQRLASALSECKDGRLSFLENGGIGEVMSDCEGRRSREFRQAALPANSEDMMSQASTSSSLTDGLKRYSAYLGLGKLPTLGGDDRKSTKQRQFEDAMERMRSNFDNAESLTTISSYDGASKSVSIVEDEDARVEAWLQRGSFVTPPELDCASQSSNVRHYTPEKGQSTLSIFPPSSPTNGKREYASLLFPLSPLNNGRDAYGNYIPTNTRDYLTAQSQPASPSREFVVEHPPQQKMSSMPHLRGGGGWWTTLGIGHTGKEPCLKGKPSTPKPGSSHRSTPVQRMKGNSSMSSQDQAPSSLAWEGGGSHVGGASASFSANAKGKTTLVVEEDDWSDESDHDGFDLDLLRQPKQLEINPHGRYGIGGPTTLSASTGPLTPTSNRQTTLPDSNSRRPPQTDALAGAKGELDAHCTGFEPSRRFRSDTRERPESPMSEMSYNTRTEKRWNKEPTTGPPIEAPPPPPKDLESSRGPASYVMPISRNQYKSQFWTNAHSHERPPSPIESYADEAWELQSLQLGESVSVAGGIRRLRQNTVARRPAHLMSPEELQVEQRRAQAEFRGLCQDVMARYDADISRLQRALQLDVISQTQFKMQKNWNVENKDRALTHSARESGYVILEDEEAIFEAMKTVNGYAIYHDMMHTTNPEVWQRLNEQHQTATSVQTPTYKPRESSLEQARHVVGKISRFLLAAPSDPSLKTFSNQKPPDAKPARKTTTVPPAWMDPTAVQAFTGTSDSEAWRTKGKKDKGKGRATLPIVGEGVDTRDFAPSAAAPLGSAAANSNGRWTGTTAVPSIRPTHFVEQPHNVQSPRDADPAAGELIRESHAPTAVSEESMWPEGDSEGNWFDAKRVAARLRGGGGKGGKKKQKEKKEKRPWLNPDHTEAMHFLK